MTKMIARLGPWLIVSAGAVACYGSAEVKQAAVTASQPSIKLLRAQAGTNYFTDEAGKAIYLTGSHVWTSVQDWGTSDPPEPLNYSGFLDFLQEHGHNFTRLWAWEHARWLAWSPEDYYITPLAYQRTGPGNALDGKPKFDLTRFNDEYFDRLRNRVTAAADRGIYVGVMLFQGFSLEGKGKAGRPFRGHPFHRDNNINGIDGDPNADDQAVEVHTLTVPAVTSIQEAYVRKVIDTLNDQDNVIWEIANECSRESWAWQFHMIRLIKSYEAAKPKQHPVWLTVPWGPGDNTASNQRLWESPADAISPSKFGMDYQNNPPAADGRKIVLIDTDHLWGIGGNRAWVWKSFTRGLNPLFMDAKYGIPGWTPTPDADAPDSKDARRSMGHTRRLAEQFDLQAMSPQPADSSEPSSTRFCLFRPGIAYIVYQPKSGEFTLALPQGRYSYAWLDPQTGRIQKDEPLDATGVDHTFTHPFARDAVLVIEKR